MKKLFGSLVVVILLGLAGLPAWHLIGKRNHAHDSRVSGTVETDEVRVASRYGNGIRRWLLSDHAKDTGCGLKVFRRDAFLALPYFDHMHRYLITLMLREGYEVRFMAVGHRPRGAGRSKYGVWDRLAVGVSDLLGVMWLKRRFKGPDTPKEL